MENIKIDLPLCGCPQGYREDCQQNVDKSCLRHSNVLVCLWLFPYLSWYHYLAVQFPWQQNSFNDENVNKKLVKAESSRRFGSAVISMMWLPFHVVLLSTRIAGPLTVKQYVKSNLYSIIITDNLHALTTSESKTCVRWMDEKSEMQMFYEEI